MGNTMQAFGLDASHRSQSPHTTPAAYALVLHTWNAAFTS